MMPGPYRSLRGVATAAWCLIALAGCQSGGAGDVLDVKPASASGAEQAARPAGPAQAAETVGTGPVAITLIVPRSAGEPLRGRAQDAVDGAKLAVSELANGQARLTIQDSGGVPATARQLAEQAISGGARMIVGPTDLASTVAIGSARPSIPVLALSSDGGRENVYAMGSDGVNSAIEGVRAAAAAGQKQIVALYPESFTAADRERLRKGVARYGAMVVGEVFYPAGAAAPAIGAAIASQKQHFAKANAALIFGPQPGVVASALVAQGLGGNIGALIGNSDWPPDAYAVPLLDGAIIALPERKNFDQVSARFRKVTGRSFSTDAAAAYDAIALAVGLTRQNPQAPVGRQVLTSDSGFLGSLGMFRLRNDGFVERRHTVYRLQGGKPVVLQGQGVGF